MSAVFISLLAVSCFASAESGQFFPYGYDGRCSDAGLCVVSSAEKCLEISASYGGIGCEQKMSIPPTSQRPPGCYGNTNTVVYNPYYTTDVGTTVSGNTRYGYICSTCENGVATDANFELVPYGGQCSDVGKCWLNTWELCNLASIEFGAGGCGGKISVEASTRPAGCYASTSSSDAVFNTLTTDYGTVISGNSKYGYFCSECEPPLYTYPGCIKGHLDNLGLRNGWYTTSTRQGCADGCSAGGSLGSAFYTDGANYHECRCGAVGVNLQGLANDPRLDINVPCTADDVTAFDWCTCPHPLVVNLAATSADCALRESNDIFVKRAAMCGGEACVAIKDDEQRTAVVWGRVNMDNGNSFSTVDLTNVAQATCGYWSCALVRTDGSAQAWGKSYYNQGVDDLNLPSRRDITMVDCGHSACVALTSNGDALFWGGPAYMGDMAPGSSVEGENFVDAGCGGHACWAMKVDSSVMVWGHADRGGNPPEGALTDVKKIQCGGDKCVSISNQGRLYTWGSLGYGGLLEPNVGDAIIADAMCGPYVCIAFSDQGQVFTWGSWHQLEPTPPSTVTGVVSAHCGYGSCVALKNDGTAISWGKSAYQHGYSGPYTNVKETHCGGYLCIALKNDGSVVSWGLANQKAGYSALISRGDLSSDIAKVQCGIRACIAVRSDGTAFTWGDRTYGGNSGSVDLTNIALEFPCQSSTAGRRMLGSQELGDYPVAEQYALRDRLLRL